VFSYLRTSRQSSTTLNTHRDKSKTVTAPVPNELGAHRDCFCRSGYKRIIAMDVTVGVMTTEGRDQMPTEHKIVVLMKSRPPAADSPASTCHVVEIVQTEEDAEPTPKEPPTGQEEPPTSQAEPPTGQPEPSTSQEGGGGGQKPKVGANGYGRIQDIPLQTLDGHPSDQIVAVREDDEVDNADSPDTGNNCGVECMYIGSKLCGCTIV